MTELNTSLPLTRLKDIVSTVLYAAEADTVEQVLQRIAHASRELVGARYAALGVPDGEGGLRYFKVSGMTEEEIALVDHPPVGAGLLGAIMNERKPLRLERMREDPRSVGFPKGHPTMTSLLGVPVQVGQQLFGMLYLTDREDGEEFTVRDQWLVETLAGYAALAIAGSQLREQRHRLTLLEERHRIGMELHDGVIQSLYAVGMYLDLMRSTGEIDPEGMQQAIDGLNAVIEDIREYIMNLKTIGYGEQTVRAALQDVIARLYVPKTVEVNIEAPDQPPPFTPADFESICFIAREALSNAVRHANARYVTVRVTQSDHQFQMMIKDDDIGFDPNDSKLRDGLGLRNIRQRAQLHHGEVKIDSAPGEGTTLMINIPTG